MNLSDGPNPAEHPVKPTDNSLNKSDKMSQQSSGSSLESTSTNETKAKPVFFPVTPDSFNSVEEFNALSYEKPIDVNPLPDEIDVNAADFVLEGIEPELYVPMLDGAVEEVQTELESVNEDLRRTTKAQLQALQSATDTVTSGLYGEQVRQAVGLRNDVDELNATLGMCVDEQCVELVDALRSVDRNLPQQYQLFPQGDTLASPTDTDKLKNDASIGQADTPQEAIARCQHERDVFFPLNKHNPKQIRDYILALRGAYPGWTMAETVFASTYLITTAASELQLSGHDISEHNRIAEELQNKYGGGGSQYNKCLIPVHSGTKFGLRLFCECRENNATGSGEEQTEEGEECKPDYKVEICNLKDLFDKVDEVTKPTDEDKPEEKRKLIAWYNCETGETKLLEARQKPDGDDWVEAGDLQSTVDTLLECICRERGRQPRRRPQPVLGGVVEGVQGLALPGCVLPTYCKINIYQLDKIHKWLYDGLIAAEIYTAVDTLAQSVNSKKLQISGGVGIVVGLFVLLEALKQFEDMTECDTTMDARAIEPLISRMWWMFWERITPGAYQEQIQAATYAINYFAPKTLPAQGELNSAFLGNAISPERWRCLTRANGNIDAYQAEIVDGQRSKPNVGELLSMYHRGVIDRQTYELGVRQLGFISGDEAEKFDRISEQVPGPTDLVRLMVRDVEDKGIVERFNLTDKFGDKFIGKIKEWAKWQNVPQEVFEKLWIAHWRYPGYHQLTEAYHRFRTLPKDHELHTDAEDVRVALEADDVPEFWVKRMIAMSFRVLTRVDVRRAYRIGVINRQDVYKNYQDLGYTDEAAEQLTKFATEEKNKRYLKHPAIRKYVSGVINESAMEMWLQQDGADEDAINLVKQRAVIFTQEVKTKNCLKALKKRYFEGELKVDDLRVEMTGLSIDNKQIEEILTRWKCEKDSRGKHASLSQLCTWFENGTMDAPEYHRRLLNLGWSTTEAERIVKVCSDRIALKLKRQEQAEMRREAAERRREERERERQRKADEAKQRRQLAASDKAAKSRLQRDKTIHRGAEKFAKRNSLEVVDVFALAKQAYNTLYRSGFGRQDVIASAIEEVLSDPQVNDLNTFDANVIQLLTADESYAN